MQADLSCDARELVLRVLMGLLGLPLVISGLYAKRRLARRLNDAPCRRAQPLEVLIEVKLTEEPAKSGAEPERVPALAAALAAFPNLHLTGLMTMPPWSDDPETSRPYFRRLRALAARLGLPQLSMGMSQDFEVAIEEGATIVRVGTALFGAREP